MTTYAYDLGTARNKVRGFGAASYAKIPKPTKYSKSSDINRLLSRHAIDMRSGFSLRTHKLKKANAKAGLPGGMNEAYETRLHGWLGCWYYRTLRHRQRPGRRAPPSRSACACRSRVRRPSRAFGRRTAQSSRWRPSTRPAACSASRSNWSIEDDQTTNPGIVLAFSKLAAQPDIVGFLGSIRSTQVHAMAPDVLKLGKPVMIGGTDPNLTHMGNQWLFRFRPNDSYSGRVIADYGVKTLGKKKWAIVHSTDAFGTAGGKALASALKSSATPRARSGLCQPEPGFHAGRAGGEAVRRRYPRHLLHLRKRPRHFRPPAAPARRQHSLGRLALDRGGVIDQARGSGAVWHLSASPTTPKIPATRSKAFGKAIARPSRSRPTTRAPGLTTPSTCCRRRSTRPARPIPAKIREAILAAQEIPGRRGRI